MKTNDELLNEAGGRDPYAAANAARELLNRAQSGALGTGLDIKITFRNMEGAFNHFVFDGEPLNVQLEYNAEQGFNLATMSDKPEKVPTRTITITVK